MIHSADTYLSQLTSSPSPFKREVTSRVVAIATTALIPLEATFRLLGTTLSIGIYAVFKPLPLTIKVYQLCTNPQFNKSEWLINEKNSLQRDVINPALLTIACLVNIVISPIIAPFSPRALITLHTDCGLTKITAKKSPVSTPISAVIQESVKEDIKTKFTSFQNDKNELAKLKKYGLSAPHCAVLHGPSSTANRECAHFIAQELNKNVKHLKFFSPEEFQKSSSNYTSNDLVYIDAPLDNTSVVYFTKILNELKCLYIIGSKLPLPATAPTSHVHIEVPLPDAATRGSIIRRELDLAIKEQNFNFETLIDATKGLKKKKIEKIINATKLLAFKKNSTIDETSALELVRIAQQKHNSSPPVVEKNDFVGMERLLAQFNKYIRVIKDPETAREWGVHLPAGLLLYGPPGCGKTYTAKQLCRYAASHGLHLNFREVKGSDVSGKWKGEGVRNIRKIFEEAKKSAPIILFIDECEGLLPSREKLQDTLSAERTQELDEALQLIEDAKHHNIIVVGATNHISSIDSAILRTGRFDYTFEVTAPDEQTRFKLFTAKLQLRKCEPNLDIASLVQQTDGFTASDIETIVNGAGLASWETLTPISMELLNESFKTVQKTRVSVSVPSKAGFPSSPPILQDLKKGLDAFRHLIGNLDGSNPEVATANDC